MEEGAATAESVADRLQILGTSESVEKAQRAVPHAKSNRRLPKVPKGTRDLNPEQMPIREKAFGIITAIFKRHGAVGIETPLFEMRETLMGKYGEDSKLIYDLSDQDGEILSLRYDLTVPFARYLAINKLNTLKRYHIARVYRRDNPAKGRYREFYQCDLDIAGHSTDPMVADFEVVKVLTELLDELDIGDYEVKLNHRKLLDGMLQICGVPQAKFRSICSAIDKLDKLSWDVVRKEMVEEKGLTVETADKIGGLVRKRGSPLVLLEELTRIDSPFSKDQASTAALEELGLLFAYLKASKCIDRIVFDLSLARGLDYYTGVIFEATLKGTFQVGSIAAGGRYDDLVGMFSGKQVPSVGVSLGIERVFAIMENQEKEKLRASQTEVLVVVLGKDKRWTEIAAEIVNDLWSGGINAEFSCVAPAKFTQQIIRAAKEGIPWLVSAGEDEVGKGTVRLKKISSKEEDELKRESLVSEVQRRLGRVSFRESLVSSKGKDNLQNGMEEGGATAESVADMPAVPHRLPKGTRDLNPEQMSVREKAFGIITTIFKRHCAVSIETPVFELRETLMGKYGEDSKLIYDLSDQGGEILSLRYDLTVPFARYLAMNKLDTLKRYHIARVYRRDNPAKGRYREFYQCDLDIAGRCTNPMVPDFEVVKVLTELLDELGVGDYEVKLNHCKLLDGMLQICGVPQAKFRSTCSAIDKLDKLSWDVVRKEMVEEKGLTVETADKIGGLVRKRGSPLVLLEELTWIDSPFSKDQASTAALEELGLLFAYLKASKCIDRIVFDLSLTRGLDYYTGVIFEATLKGTFQVGSIAAGGRYDDLVGMFSGKQVPSVGVSLGIERVFAIMENQEKEKLRASQTEVLVVVLGKDKRWTEIAAEIVNDLWSGGINAEFSCVAPAKFTQQIIRAAKEGIPWLVSAGEDEVAKGTVRLKKISSNEEDELKRESLVSELQRRLGRVSTRTA